MKASTAGSASPSFMPDSRLSEWRTIRGTRGFVTTLDESTGSVGDSSAPTRKLSAQPSPVSQCVATATITHVSGIATTSLRSGSRHAFCSISASTSRPSRNRITISATSARSCTKPERGSMSSTPNPPSPSRKPASTKTAVSDRNERWASPDASAPSISSPPRMSAATSKPASASSVMCTSLPHQEGLESSCASPCWESRRPGRTPTAPARATSSRAAGRPCCSTAGRASSPSCAATSTTSTSTPW